MLSHPIVLSTSGVSTSITLLDPSSSLTTQTITPFPDYPLSVEFPSSVVPQFGSSLLIITENPRNIYFPLREASLRSATPVLSANFYVNATLAPLSNLVTRFNLTIPFLPSSTPVHRLTEAVFAPSPTTSKEQVISRSEVSCQFYD